MNTYSLLTPAALALALGGAADVLQAETPVTDSRPRLFLGVGLTHGGEELGEVRVIYDHGREDEELRSGDLMTLTVGFVIPLPLPALSVQASAGYHFDQVSADDDEVVFERYPLELLAFYNFDRHRIGTGFSHHLDPELDLRDARGPRVEFEDATGTLIEYDYSFAGWNSHGPVVGIRYMWIDYGIDQVNGVSVRAADVDGNHLGVHFNYLF